MEGKLISTSFRSNRIGEQSQNPHADQFIKQLKKKNLAAAAQPSPERNSLVDKIPKAHNDSTRKKIRLSKKKSPNARRPPIIARLG